MPSAITNKDIMITLGRIEEKVDTVTKLAEKTNGRVTTIENWKNGLEAIELYKEKAATQVKTEQGNVIVQATTAKLDAQTKMYLAVAGLVTIASGLIGALK